ncbi:MAG: SRPBCC family protein [Betaproteobacteria bacterium]
MFPLLQTVLAFFGCSPSPGAFFGSLLFVVMATISLRNAAADSPRPADIAVAAHRDGEAIVVDVSLVVQASPRETWDVLTDYDHMARFVSSVTMSRIVSRSNGTLLVAQTSRFRFGLIALTFDSVREIEFIPLREIRSRLLRGDMKGSAFTTRLMAEDGATRIVNHARYIPDRWVPPVIGIAMLKAETRTQFGELRAEIMRRKAREGPSRRYGTRHRDLAMT